MSFCFMGLLTMGVSGISVSSANGSGGGIKIKMGLGHYCSPALSGVTTALLLTLSLSYTPFINWMATI